MTSGSEITILECLDDPELFGRQFVGPSWNRWRVFLMGLFGLAMDDTAIEVFAHHTGRSVAPVRPFREAALVIGRRGGKSRILALIAVYVSTMRSYEEFLAPGEQPVVAIIAADRRQARLVLRYILGLLRGVALLSPLIESTTAESVTLVNGVQIEIHTGSIASPRGRTFIGVLCDEIAFWASDETAANPDSDVVASVRPGLISIPGSILLLSSSPYGKRGVLWNNFRRHFGHDDGRVLIWRGTSLEMNPIADEAAIAEAYEDDPISAASEFGAEFRADLVGFIDREVVERLVARGVYERAPLPGVSYACFVDPAGGAGRDSMVLVVGHRASDDIVIIDCIREWRPPFNPVSVVAEAEPVLQAYRIGEIFGDYWGGEWVGERLTEGSTRKYTRCDRVKSLLYLESLPVMTSGRVQLLDHPRAIAQIAGLERRTARSGKDSVDHMPGAHDDLANGICGCIVQLAKPDEMSIWAALGRAA